MRLPALAVAVLLAVCFSAAAQTPPCHTESGTSGFSVSYRNHPVHDLGDYGLIFEDAKRRDCSGGYSDQNVPMHGAAEALRLKLEDSLAEPADADYSGRPGKLVFHGWLESYSVALIFSSALEIGGHGDLRTPLKNQLEAVISRFDSAPTPYGRADVCGFNSPGIPVTPNQEDPDPANYVNGWEGRLSDTCMDDHAGGASAYAWIAAYKYKSMGAVAAAPYVQKARNAISSALSPIDSVCINDPALPYGPISGRGPCNVTTNAQITAALGGTTPRGETISLNRGENIVYGAGLMTSVASALIGLEEAGAQTYLTDIQKLVARGLLLEAQKKTTPTGSSFKGAPEWGGTCTRFEIVGGIQRYQSHPCADGDHRPTMFKLASTGTNNNSVYSRYVGYAPATQVVDLGVTQNAYAFNSFNSDWFSLHPLVGNAQNWGRRVTYGNLGASWNDVVQDVNRDAQAPAAGELRPRLWAHLDDNNPQGYLDNINASGVATGWSCDRDLPQESIAVAFYVGDVFAGAATHIVDAEASVGSEQAVNDLCLGGTAHRFSMPLPSWTKGQPIYAYGLDATWRGFTKLTSLCAGAPACTW